VGGTVSYFARFEITFRRVIGQKKNGRIRCSAPPACTVSSLMSSTVTTVFEDCCTCHWGNASLTKADASLSLGHVLPHDGCSNRADLRSTA